MSTISSTPDPSSRHWCLRQADTAMMLMQGQVLAHTACLVPEPCCSCPRTGKTAGWCPSRSARSRTAPAAQNTWTVNLPSLAGSAQVLGPASNPGHMLTLRAWYQCWQLSESETICCRAVLPAVNSGRRTCGPNFSNFAGSAGVRRLLIWTAVPASGVCSGHAPAFAEPWSSEAATCGPSISPRCNRRGCRLALQKRAVSVDRRHGRLWVDVRRGARLVLRQRFKPMVWRESAGHGRCH